MIIKSIASSSKGNCYSITKGNSTLLLECGIPAKAIRAALGFNLSGVAGCLCSHEHLDHSKATKDVMRAGVDVYTSRGTIEALGLSGHRINVIKALDQFTIAGWTVLPFETKHDAVEPLGFLVGKDGDKLLYATDTYYLPYKFEGLTHILIEASFDKDILNANIKSGAVPAVIKKRLIRSHFSLDNVIKFFEANDLSKLKETWLIHLSNKNSDADRFKEAVQRETGRPVYIA